MSFSEKDRQYKKNNPPPEEGALPPVEPSDQTPPVEPGQPQADPGAEPQTGTPEAGTAEQVSEDTVAGNGLMTWIRRKRLERTQKKLEKYDRKERLYTSLGQIALGHKQRTITDPRPTTVAERYLDWRLSRRAQKKATAQAFTMRAEMIHGPDKAKEVPSVRHSLTLAALSPVAGKTKELTVNGPVRPAENGAGPQEMGAILGKEKHDDIGVVATIGENIARLWKGAEIPGKSPLRRKIDKTVLVGRVIGGDSQSADEIRHEYRSIESADIKTGGMRHRVSRRKHRKQEELTELAANQPIASAFRRVRGARAQKRLRKLEEKLGVERVEPVIEPSAEQTDTQAESKQDEDKSNWSAVLKHVAQERLVNYSGLAWHDTKSSMYFLLRERVRDSDGDYTVSRYKKRKNLVNDRFSVTGPVPIDEIKRRLNDPSTEEFWFVEEFVKKSKQARKRQ